MLLWPLLLRCGSRAQVGNDCVSGRVIICMNSESTQRIQSYEHIQHTYLHYITYWYVSMDAQHCVHADGASCIPISHTICIATYSCI